MIKSDKLAYFFLLVGIGLSLLFYFLTNISSDWQILTLLAGFGLAILFAEPEKKEIKLDKTEEKIKEILLEGANEE